VKHVACDIDEIPVPEWMITSARAGSNVAKDSLRDELAGEKLRKGIRTVPNDCVLVSIRELGQLGIVKELTIAGTL
jgi:hypothetical protein